MGKANGKSNVEPESLDLEHELPASDEPGEEALVRDNPPSGGVEVSGVPPELEKLKAERNLLVDRLARLQAEFENARKRAAREQEDFREYALADAIRVLLPTLDSFERALQTSSEAAEFRGGIELIYKQLQDALAKLGLRPITAKGVPFDPHVHQAIEMVETADAEDHQVLEELQRGYKLKDRLLRPSMVKVAKNSRR